MAAAPHLTLLHLSDIQLGPHHRFEPPSAPGGLLHRLREDMERMRAEEGLRPDLVLLTGDLTEYGLKSQFNDLLSFVNGLVEVTELPPRRIVVVPGNHDINWDLSKAYFAERAGNEEKAVQPYWPKLKHYADFFARFYEGQPGITFTEKEPWTFYEMPEIKVVVAGLDSVMAESHRPEDHYGFLGERQLDFFAGALRPYKERGWLRIGAVHHDLLHPENDAARQDAKDLKGRLLPYLNMVVHGHIHEEQLGWLDNTVPVLGIGSAGVKVPERPPEVPNQYQWVQVYADKVVYGTRAYVPDQKRWVGCLRSDPEGKAWKVEKAVAFERVGETFSGKGGSEKAPEADLAAMVEAYRRHWANAYRREALFDLATMGEDADIPAGLDLLHVFVPQMVQEAGRARPAELNQLQLPMSPPRPLPFKMAGPRRVKRKDLSQPIESLLWAQRVPWQLLLGAPGAGKSALTRWIVLKLCSPGEATGIPNDSVPVRVEMRRFDLQYRHARQAGRSYDFFDYLDELHRERNLSLQAESLRRLAEAGRLFWLFDGLDEVADPRARQDYAAMIVGVRDRFKGRGIITSRIIGAEPARPLFDQAGINTYALQDFDNDQIDTFLERWHRLAFPGATEAAASRLDRLRRTLKDNRSVRELCGNPLLLTFIALLNRGTELPRQRHRLYERAVELMADQWEANKKLPVATAVRFDLAIKKRFLRNLAFKMMTEFDGGSGNAVQQRYLVDFAADFCAREYAIKADEARSTATHLIEHLRERNYILALMGGDVFGFVHKTFLEYLAATEIHSRFRSHTWGMPELKKVFREHWQDQTWHETLTLICGILDDDRPAQVIDLLQAVLEHLHPFDASAEDYGAFALACLAEVRQVSEEPVRAFCLYLTQWLIAQPHRQALSLNVWGSEWPGAPVLQQAALDPAGSREALDNNLAYLALQTSSRESRRDLLLHLTRRTSFAFNVIVEANRISRLTPEEALDLRGYAARASKHQRAQVLASLASVGANISAAESAWLDGYAERSGRTPQIMVFTPSDEHVTYPKAVAALMSDIRTSGIASALRSVSDFVAIGAVVHLRAARRTASEWRPILEYLSRSAKKGSTRLHAAKLLLDERRISQLATRSKSPEVRRDAARSLEILSVYRALLQVGRPRRGIVSLDGTRVGIIEETPTGSRFIYDVAYLARPGAVPISATLPLQPEPFEARGLHPYFDNLLPEGWLLDQTCQKLGIDRTDAFGLMLATCADCAGAVEIVPEPPPALPRP